ncbi:MAG: L-rhamnose isomerase [Kiritimatiellia bacterium]
MSEKIEQAYRIAKEKYAEIGVDTDVAMAALEEVPVSMNCWQGDDVGGFESVGGSELSGGIQATGNYPGKARTIGELRDDIEKALSLIPGTHRLNLHASYLDNNGVFVDRDAIEPEHFKSWIDWGRDRLHGMDFNPTFFSHDKAADGFTLAHPDQSIRDFWIEHAKRCRVIGAEMGRQFGTATVTNFWVPDSYKDTPADRWGPRVRLADSLDKCFAEKIDPRLHLDAVESKLFGIGGESYTAGSHEFYMGYAVSRQKLLCLDAGHYHPTEVISEKISSVMMFCPELLLHVSRPVRWDSDHVVCFDDELQQIAKELVRSGQLEKVHIGLDFFDASINRVAAWVIGTRNMVKALLFAMLEPIESIREAELNMDFTKRLVMFEELKTMPWSAVWDYYCLKQGVPVGLDWFNEITRYESDVLSKR